MIAATLIEPSFLLDIFYHVIFNPNHIVGGAYFAMKYKNSKNSSDYNNIASIKRKLVKYCLSHDNFFQFKFFYTSREKLKHGYKCALLPPPPLFYHNMTKFKVDIEIFSSSLFDTIRLLLKF